jgi:uncharacterized secreted protein with C-terminal beta-propeller domain
MKTIQMKIMTLIGVTILVGAALFYYLNQEYQVDLDIDYPSYDLLNFDSYEEFNTYLQDSPTSNTLNRLSGANGSVPGTEVFDIMGEGGKAVGMDEDYSSTNIQELGVDEPDIIKTDGEFLFVIANATVFIIRGYPAEEATILATIHLNETLIPLNLFVNENKLAIITHSYIYRPYVLESYDDVDIELYEENEEKVEDSIDESVVVSSEEILIDEKSIRSSSIGLWADTITTHIIIYDISEKTSPVLVQEVQMEGYYSAARMIEEYLYVITTYYDYNPVLYTEEDSSFIPTINVDGKDETVDLSDIYYVDSPERSRTLAYVASMNILDEKEDVNPSVFMLGNPSLIYVSLNAIYITSMFNVYDYDFLDEIFEEYILPALPSAAREEFELVESLSLEEYQKSMVSEWILYNYIEDLDEESKEEIVRQIVTQYEKTTIHKITIDEGMITYAAQGAVPGNINNQFSIDEYEGNLRVATTVNGWMMRSYVSSLDTYNNVYVLNESLDIIGEVEDIAVGETIYSVRYMDTFCYLVTFRQVDPFFVIDLQDPMNPRILGELKIPGYSTYLHPYDEDHIIGFGMENNTVKITLFNVDDVSNPTELDTYRFEEKTEEYTWMYSTALYEHKAFLFDRMKNLLILPVSMDYIESAYVINISLDGIELRGVISHRSEENISDTYEPWESAYWKGDYRYSIKRSLYIKDVIFTFSDAMIQMNDMETLDRINAIELL